MARQNEAVSETRRPDGAQAEGLAVARRDARPARPVEVPREQDGGAENAASSARSASPGRGWTPWIVGALIVAIMVGAGWWWFGRGRGAPDDGKAAEAPRVPVEVARAQTRDVPIFLEGLGTVQALNTVLVRSRVDGEIQQILFREGQIVQKGDVIAQIDPRPYQAVLDQALAKKLQDEATRVSNRTDLSRTQELAAKGFAPRQQFDQQTAQVGSIDAQIAIDQALIDNARVQLDYTTIRAPLTGRTGLRLTDQGNIVRATDQTGIVEIAQLQPIAAIFTAPEQQLSEVAGALKAGPVEVRAVRSDGKEELGRGGLELINNSVDAASGTVRLKATFPNADERLWPGLSINTRLLVRSLSGVVTVPEDAIQRGPADLFVFVVKNDGAAERRTVRVGPFAGGAAVIEDGVRDGETVVTGGQSRLKEGTKVDPGKQDASSTPPRNGEARPTPGG